jgi:enoyl-CoA hydratase/carnithine racemase
MDYSGYRRLHVEVDRRVVTVTIDNRPMNLITRELLAELDRFSIDVGEDDHASVVVLRSSDPDIFMTHNEFANLYAIQPDELPTTSDDVEPNGVQRICLRFLALPQVTIAEVAGRTAGGSAALVMACDLRFGALGKAVFNTMAVPLGTVPGGGASALMPRLVGRARALELILGGLDLDAATAERWGYLNRALPAEELESYVAALARRIASCPPDAVRLTKELMQAPVQEIEDAMREENYRFRRLMASPGSRDSIRAFLDLGGETREGEQRIEDLLGEVLDRMNP